MRLGVNYLIGCLHGVSEIRAAQNVGEIGVKVVKGASITHANCKDDIRSNLTPTVPRNKTRQHIRANVNHFTLLRVALRDD